MADHVWCSNSLSLLFLGATECVGFLDGTVRDVAVKEGYCLVRKQLVLRVFELAQR